MHTILWLENLKGRDHFEDLGVDREDNIRMDLTEVGCEIVDWIHLAQDMKDSATQYLSCDKLYCDAKFQDLNITLQVSRRVHCQWYAPRPLRTSISCR